MKGFKPTGHGPSSGFKFPTRMGFTGSTGAYTNVSPYVRRKGYANGGFVRQDNPRMKSDEIGDQGSALVRRARSSNALDQESGGKTPLRPGFKRGGKLRKANGGVTDGGYRAWYGAEDDPEITDQLAKVREADNRMRRLPAEESWRHKAQGPKAVRPRGHGPIRKADGGDVKLPRRQKPYTFAESLRAVPAAIKEALRYGMSSAGSQSTGMAKKAADTISGRQKRIDDYLDEAESGRTASNYARGGKMKRMGYAGGGLAALMRHAMEPRGQKRDAPMPPMARPIMRGTMRAKGGRAKCMGYADGGGRRDGMVPEKSTPKAPAPKGTGTKAPGPFPPASTVKEKFYADGGGVSAKQAKRIAERTVGDHVRYPAPKGHKGLEKAMRRN